MRRLWIILLFGAIAFSATATTFHYACFTYTPTTSPKTVDNSMDSVHVVVYKDNGTTAIDSGYTDEFGLFRTQKLYKASGYMRALVTKTGYATTWVRFSVANLDTTTDSIYTVPIRMISNVGDSTLTLAFRLINGDGTPAVGISCQARISSPHRTEAGNWCLAKAGYSPISVVSDEGGNVEFDILKNSTVQLWVDGISQFEPFLMDSSRTLGNVYVKP